MPNVTPQDVHVNRALTSFSVAYRQQLDNYIAHLFAPIVPVSKQSDLYFEFDKGDLLRNVAKVRAPGTESAGSDVGIDPAGPYYCSIKAIHQDLDMDVVANADQPLNPKRAATRNVVQWLLTKMEVDFADTLFKAGVWGTDWTGNTSTSDASAGTFERWNRSTSTPATDIENARAAVQAATGFMPNTLAISYDVFSVLKNHPDLIDRIKYTQRGVIKRSTADILADLFDLERVIVTSAIRNTANEGATDAISRIMSNGALLGYVNPTPAIEMPSASYTFVWNNLFGSVQNEPGGMGMRMLDYPIVPLKVHRIEGEMPYDMKPIATDCAIFLDNVLTA